jgi:Cu/Ag efflux protein CusF
MLRLSALVIATLFLINATSVALAQDVYSYTVKGVVKALPGNGRAANEILVKHEPIPDYRDQSGKVVGMMAMTMPFYLSEKLSAEGIKVGDNVEMVVEQRLAPRYSESVVALKKVELAK